MSVRDVLLALLQGAAVGGAAILLGWLGVLIGVLVCIFMPGWLGYGGGRS